MDLKDILVSFNKIQNNNLTMAGVSGIGESHLKEAGNLRKIVDPNCKNCDGTGFRDCEYCCGGQTTSQYKTYPGYAETSRRCRHNCTGGLVRCECTHKLDESNDSISFMDRAFGRQCDDCKNQLATRKVGGRKLCDLCANNEPIREGHEAVIDNFEDTWNQTFRQAMELPKKNVPELVGKKNISPVKKLGKIIPFRKVAESKTEERAMITGKQAKVLHNDRYVKIISLVSERAQKHFGKGAKWIVNDGKTLYIIDKGEHKRYQYLPGRNECVDYTGKQIPFESLTKKFPILKKFIKNAWDVDTDGVSMEPNTCKSCGGSKKLYGQPCKACKGRGKLKEESANEDVNPLIPCSGDKLTVNTTKDSEGANTITVSADGEKATELETLLKNAGLLPADVTDNSGDVLMPDSNEDNVILDFQRLAGISSAKSAVAALSLTPITESEEDARCDDCGELYDECTCRGLNPADLDEYSEYDNFDLAALRRKRFGNFDSYKSGGGSKKGKLKEDKSSLSPTHQDAEWVNQPNEQTLGAWAQLIDMADGPNKPSVQYNKFNKGDNPITIDAETDETPVKKLAESLLKKFQDWKRVLPSVTESFSHHKCICGHAHNQHNELGCDQLDCHCTKFEGE